MGLRDRALGLTLVVGVRCVWWFGVVCVRWVCVFSVSGLVSFLAFRVSGCLLGLGFTSLRVSWCWLLWVDAIYVSSCFVLFYGFGVLVVWSLRAVGGLA